MANKYLSDLHLGHARILEMSRRGERFADVEEMNEYIIRQWNLSCALNAGFDINDHPVTLEELMENNSRWYERENCPDQGTLP